MDPVNVSAKFEVRIALPVPEIITIKVLGGVANPNLREEEAVGVRGWYRSKEFKSSQYRAFCAVKT